LLTSGLFALWGLIDAYGRNWFAKPAAVIGGVRLSSGAATSARARAPEKSDVSRPSHAAAPQDGRTPNIRKAAQDRLKQAGRAVVLLTLGWPLGFFLAAPQVLPFLEYTRTSDRAMRRSAGEEDRPPVGLAALPQVLLPDLHGSTQAGSLPLFPKGQGN